MKNHFLHLTTKLLLVLGFLPETGAAQTTSTIFNDQVDAVTKQLNIFNGDKSPRTMHRAVSLAGAVPLDRGCNDWEKQRELKLALLLDVLMIIDNSTDPKFNPNDPPALHVLPPIEAGNIQTGMPPSAIKDPILRKQYEAAIEDNGKRLAYFNRERILRFVRDEAVGVIISFLKHSYGENERKDAERVIEKTVTAPKLKAFLQDALQEDAKVLNETNKTNMKERKEE